MTSGQAPRLRLFRINNRTEQVSRGLRAPAFFRSDRRLQLVVTGRPRRRSSAGGLCGIRCRPARHFTRSRARRGWRTPSGLQQRTGTRSGRSHTSKKLRVPFPSSSSSMNGVASMVSANPATREHLPQQITPLSTHVGRYWVTLFRERAR